MTVVVPAGLPLEEAARWVGSSCWSELHVHQLITDVLAGGGLSDEERLALWRVRANRAETAEAWHRRLPELRELPRASFVLPPADDPPWERSAQVDADGATHEVAAWLRRLDERYAAHAPVAVGPADGPTAATLSWARWLLAHDLAVVTPTPG